jgi:Predicted membrane protein (DUF2127)
VERKAISVDSSERQSRNSSWTPLLHRIFVLGVVAKGVDGALELFGGLLLLLLSPTAIWGTIFFLVQGELKEDPTDVVANLLMHNAGTVIQTRIPASAFLIAHGVVKLGLVVSGSDRGLHWVHDLPALPACSPQFPVPGNHQCLGSDRHLFDNCEVSECEAGNDPTRFLDA